MGLSISWSPTSIFLGPLLFLIYINEFVKIFVALFVCLLITSGSANLESWNFEETTKQNKKQKQKKQQQKQTKKQEKYFGCIMTK